MTDVELSVDTYHDLLQQLGNSPGVTDTTKHVHVQGRIKHKRTLSSKLSFLDLITPTDLCIQIVLKKDRLEEKPIDYDTLLSLARPGSIFQFQGFPCCDRPNSLSIYSKSAQLISIKESQPDWVYIKKLLQFVLEDKLKKQLVLSLLEISSEQFEELLQLLESKNKNSLKRKADACARTLMGLEPVRAPKQRKYAVNPSEAQLLDSFNSVLRPIRMTEEAFEESSLPFSFTEDLDESSLEKVSRGISRREYVHGKKIPQILWMGNRIGEMLVNFELSHSEVKSIKIVDVGGGRGDLSVYLAARFKDRVSISVIDSNPDAIGIGNSRALQHGLKNVHFQCLSASEFDFSEQHLLVGLHACGGLSDLIIQTAMCVPSIYGFIMCPCCFGKHSQLITVDQAHWMDSLDSEQTCRLCKLAERSDSEVSNKAMQIINSLRIESALKSSGYPWSIELLSFNPMFSPKNQVILGIRSSASQLPD